MVKRFFIRDVKIDPPVVLAPMEDVTNRAFRRIAKRIGNPGLVVTEFVSAMATYYNAKQQLDKLEVGEDERPVAIQIFGAEPEIMAEAARKVEGEGADICDINMGCWVPKVCKTGSGAALLKDHDQAVRVAEAVVKAVNIPVTVKVRAGWDCHNLTAPALAKRFERIGVQAITLHARTARQGFDGKADWELIKELKQSVTIPVIGNGDIKEPEDALRMLEETGCDGVMIGRSAISNPWILRRVAHFLETGELLPEPSVQERIDTAIEHVTLLAGLWQNELRASRHLRGQLPLYLKGFPGAAKLRERLSRVESVAEVKEVMRSIDICGS